MKWFLSLALFSASVAGASGLPDLLLPPLGPLPSAAFSQVHEDVLKARDALSGVSTPTGEPWPCQGTEMRAGTVVSPGQAMQAVQAALQQQGFNVTRKATFSGGVSLLAHHPAGMNVLAAGLDATRAVSARVVVCERADVWTQPAEPVVGERAIRIGDFNAQVSDWTRGRMSVKVQTRVGEKVIPLGRGLVAPDGTLNMQLARPTAGALRPALELPQQLGALPGCSGRLFADALRVQGAGRVNSLVAFDVLNVPFEGQAQAAALQGAPVQAQLVSTRSTPLYQAALSLVYADAPVRLTGTLRCEDTQHFLKVTLSLPGGWSPVEVRTYTDEHQELLPALPGALRSWLVQDVPGMGTDKNGADVATMDTEMEKLFASPSVKK